MKANKITRPITLLIMALALEGCTPTPDRVVVVDETKVMHEGKPVDLTDNPGLAFDLLEVEVSRIAAARKCLAQTSTERVAEETITRFKTMGCRPDTTIAVLRVSSSGMRVLEIQFNARGL